MWIIVSSTTGTVSVDKITDLFDAELFHQDESSAEISREIDSQIVNEILRALGNKKSEPTQDDRRRAFIDSLPENAQTSLNNLVRMLGASSLEEMFTAIPVETVQRVISEINKVDLYRVWQSWKNA